jgi:hypothetical protein
MNMRLSSATLAALAALILPAAFLAGCAAKKFGPEKAAAVDLDSLHRVQQYQDSVESNHFFYEESYAKYREKFPGVLKGDYLRAAKGKDQDFCLFKPDPAAVCLESGDKFNDVGLKESARDCYEAGLLSEGANTQAQNIRLWGSLGQLTTEAKDYEAGRTYLRKLLEVEPKNKWAKKLLASIPAE